MKDEELISKLIHTYPNSIVYDYDSFGHAVLNFPETVDNFAENIINDFDFNRQKYHFKVTFENKDDCIRYISTHFVSLYEMCQDWINDNVDECD